MTVDKAQYAGFLAGLERGLSVTGAAAAAGIDRGLAYTWREEDPEFAAAWRLAAQAGADLLEDEALRRAMEGVEKPVFYRGQQVGTVRVYNDRLLMWLLQRRRPAPQAAEPDLRKALEEADARRQELTCKLERANERIAQLDRQLMEARQTPAGASLRDDVPPLPDGNGFESPGEPALAASVKEDARHGDAGTAAPVAPPAASASPPVSKDLSTGAAPSGEARHVPPSPGSGAGQPGKRAGVPPVWASPRAAAGLSDKGVGLPSWVSPPASAGPFPGKGASNSQAP